MSEKNRMADLDIMRGLLRQIHHRGQQDQEAGLPTSLLPEEPGESLEPGWKLVYTSIAESALGAHLTRQTDRGPGLYTQWQRLCKDVYAGGYQGMPFMWVKDFLGQHRHLEAAYRRVRARIRSYLQALESGEEG